MKTQTRFWILGSLASLVVVTGCKMESQTSGMPAPPSSSPSSVVVTVVLALVAEFVRRQPRLVAALAVGRAGEPGTDPGEPVPRAGTAAKRVVGRQHFQSVQPVGRAEPVQRATERWQPIAGVLRRELRQRTAPIGWQPLVRRARWRSVFGSAGVAVIGRARWCSVFGSAGVAVIGRARWCSVFGSAKRRSGFQSAGRWHSFHVVGRAATRRLILGWAAVGRQPVHGRRARRQPSVRWIGTLDRRWCARRIHAVGRGWRVRRIHTSRRRWRLGWSYCDRSARDSRCGQSPGRGSSGLAWSAGDRCTGHAGFSGTERRRGCVWGRRFAVRSGLATDRARTRVAGNVVPGNVAARRSAHRRWRCGRRAARRNKAAPRAARRATRARRAKVGPAADR